MRRRSHIYIYLQSSHTSRRTKWYSPSPIHLLWLIRLRGFKYKSARGHILQTFCTLKFMTSTLFWFGWWANESYMYTYILYIVDFDRFFFVFLDDPPSNPYDLSNYLWCWVDVERLLKCVILVGTCLWYI